MKKGIIRGSNLSRYFQRKVVGTVTSCPGHGEAERLNYPEISHCTKLLHFQEGMTSGGAKTTVACTQWSLQKEGLPSRNGSQRESAAVAGESTKGREKEKGSDLSFSIYCEQCPLDKLPARLFKMSFSGRAESE